MDPSAATEVLNLGITSYRRYVTTSSETSRATAPLALTAGEYYYIEGQYINNGGADYFTVGVEIE